MVTKASLSEFTSKFTLNSSSPTSNRSITQLTTARTSLILSTSRISSNLNFRMLTRTTQFNRRFTKSQSKRIKSCSKELTLTSLMICNGSKNILVTAQHQRRESRL